MASPLNDSYSVASGATLRAGRFGWPAAPGNYLIGLWGQSNAIGLAERSELSASPLSDDPDLADYDDGTKSFTRVYIWDGADFSLLVPGTNNGGSDADTFGPEFGLAVRWERESASGNLYIYKAASGGVSITTFEPGVGSNWFIADGIVDDCLAWLSSEAVTLTAKAMIWTQGESDASETQGWYQSRMEDLIDAWVSNGHLDADSKIVLSQMAVGTATYGAGVAAAKAAIDAASEVVSAIAYPYYVNGDNIHYNARGQVQHAYDAISFIFGAEPMTV